MQDEQLEQLRATLTRQRYPLLFITLSGSHLYGFSSPDSDYDLRGAHILPLREVIGLREGEETIEQHHSENGLEVDLVTYDVRKCLTLLLGKNGNVLEAIYSPLVIHTTPEHEELKALAMRCVTRYYAYHYLGFARNRLKQASHKQPPSIKSVLHTYRVILTGLHLVRTGELEANLRRLNEVFRFSSVADLIARKEAGGEKAQLEEGAVALYEAEWRRLLSDLEQSVESSVLPVKPDAQAQAGLNDLLIRLRLQTV
ncbi:MAG: nucleotidyltransferase domain-containing protein [Thermogemmatispora sp.]|uniref:Nucleotidyltransferase n=1 Tax=Thermogemmatispora aurantia TaxID=2045279 RepID=A0A5J4K885_9CHLR|nr:MULTISPECIES: nucleotidyltransferase domain-containing protein [Thermogemmatispora]MBE3567221.1 nucleotidyltransferase domain-containing protein [Thermogemmatispora sp.]GER83813.1 nucleotidyltransferase [Thermogemmatispora aurantia]